MADFTGDELRGSRFQRADLSGSRFWASDLSGTRFRGVDLLRHLVFATDAWVRRAIGGDPSPWDPLDLPWDEMPDTVGVPPAVRRTRPGRAGGARRTGGWRTWRLG